MGIISFVLLKTQFKLSYSPKTFNGRMEYLTGKEQGRISGLTDWKTYRVIDNETVYEKDKRTQFWLPTYQYFIEFPLRILEADKKNIRFGQNLEISAPV